MTCWAETHTYITLKLWTQQIKKKHIINETLKHDFHSSNMQETWDNIAVPLSTFNIQIPKHEWVALLF